MIKKVLISNINADHPQIGQRRAFKYLFGEDNVREVDYLQLQRDGKTVDEINEIFKLNVLAFKPDWVFLQVQETGILLAETLSYLKTQLPNTVFTHWTGDYRSSVSPYLSSICKAVDHTFISSAGQIPLFEEAGAESVSYLQIGLDREEDILGLPDWTPPFRVPDVVFIGNHYGDYFPIGTAQRLATIRAIQAAGIDIGVVGSGWPEDINVVGTCGVKQQYHVYKRAKVALNVNHINDVALYYSDRQLIAMASGTPLVCWKVPELEKEFVLHQTVFGMCYPISSPEEAVEAITSLLKYEQIRERLGVNGRREVLKNHDWVNRIVQATEVVEALQEGD